MHLEHQGRSGRNSLGDARRVMSVTHPRRVTGKQRAFVLASSTSAVATRTPAARLSGLLAAVVDYRRVHPDPSQIAVQIKQSGAPRASLAYVLTLRLCLFRSLGHHLRRLDKRDDVMNDPPVAGLYLGRLNPNVFFEVCRDEKVYVVVGVAGIDRVFLGHLKDYIRFSDLPSTGVELRFCR